MTEKADRDILLVAVDFSPYSEQALCFAGRLAEKLKVQRVVQLSPVPVTVVKSPRGK